MTLKARRLFDAIDATWPAARVIAAGPWILRDGQGGGKRVSAATARAQVSDEDLGAAEEAMRMMGQEPLFAIRDGNQTLDMALAARGYDRIDPVNIYVCRTEELTDVPVPLVTAFTIWEPLAIMREIWTTQGIGPARQAVMDRAGMPRTALFGRIDDKPAGAGFTAVHDRIAMVHALEVMPDLRRKGIAQWMMRAAAFWAQDWGAEWMAVLCTQDNRPANKLYQKLGFQVAGAYHYRILPRPEET